MSTRAHPIEGLSGKGAEVVTRRSRRLRAREGRRGQALPNRAVATLADMQPAQASGPDVRRERDRESQEWLADLRADGTVHDAAVERSYGLLVRAAHLESCPTCREESASLRDLVLAEQGR